MGAWRMLANPNAAAQNLPMDRALYNPATHPAAAQHFAGFKALQEEDMNGSEAESEVVSDTDPVEETDSQQKQLESAHHREILEKLQRQEMEEQDEIDRELAEAQKDALRAAVAGATHHGCDDDDDKMDDGGSRGSVDGVDGVGDENSGYREEPVQTEIRTQRPPGLLAQHGITTKSHIDRERGREREREKERENKERVEMEKDMEEEQSEMEKERLERIAPLDFTHPAFMDRPFSHSPPMVSTPTGLPSIGSNNSAAGDTVSSSPGHHWTFEEQFKQLYELSDDVKRREFLDDIFSFMQKRGTPVNRIPIMAKQPLDLYELFRLVVSKGGLVEVINKKLWREVCKGLNLPSSITSAAFTLRTQYMKYLYPYECEKLKLSNPSELQSAIDGNRREGRRPSYGYDFSPIPTMMPPTPHMNGGPPGPHHHMMNGGRHGSPPAGLMMDSIKFMEQSKFLDNAKLMETAKMMDHTKYLDHHHQKFLDHAKLMDPTKFLEPAKLFENMHGPGDEHDGSLPTTPNHLRAMAERDQRAMEAAQRAMEEATKRMEEAQRAITSSSSAAVTTSPSSAATTTSSMPFSSSSSHPPPHLASHLPPPKMEPRERRPTPEAAAHHAAGTPDPSSLLPPPPKRMAMDHDDREQREREQREQREQRERFEQRFLPPHFPAIPNTHLKITSRTDGHGGEMGENSMVVSMEINGMTYQGVLFAQHPRRI